MSEGILRTIVFPSATETNSKIVFLAVSAICYALIYEFVNHGSVCYSVVPFGRTITTLFDPENKVSLQPSTQDRTPLTTPLLKGVKEGGAPSPP